MIMRTRLMTWRNDIIAMQFVPIILALFPFQNFPYYSKRNSRIVGLSLPLTPMHPTPMHLHNLTGGASDTTYFSAGFFAGMGGVGRHFSLSYQTVNFQTSTLTTTEQ